MFNCIIEEDDKDDFLIENYIYESSLLSHEEKKEINYFSLQRNENKTLELNFNNNDKKITD